MKLELHIEELVLHGFSSRDRYAIAAAVEQTLAQLLTAQFAEQSVPPSLTESREHARLDAGTFNVAPGANSAAVGGQIAQTVHRGLTG